jgi:hypothetical protein
MTPQRRFPTLTAAALYAAVVALAFWPFWTGHFLINPWSDMRNGYAFRLFAAEYWHQAGGFPQWNPYIFGGMPFIGAIGGDVFYPTFLLRLILPVDVGITLGFMLHLVLAGVFMFAFLRALGLEWGAAFVGGAAYMFTGQLVSLVSPGHDGKLFVSALLPLVLLLLHQAVRRADWRWYVYLGAAVGLCLVSPHFQATYYVLMAAGFFWLFLWFASDERPTGTWWRSALLFGLALGVAFAIAAIQMLPFREYLALSARGGGATPGNVDPWTYHTGWSMPPEELLNGLWPAFSGMLESYWGRNAFKLHSEYVGVVVLLLASCAPALRQKRRWSWFFAFLAAYGILFALGGYTPFYRIPYVLLPGIKLTRAPSTIFFLTSFSIAALAAFGTQALLAGEAGLKKSLFWWWAGGMLAATLLAYAGVFENIMRAIADPQRVAAVAANYGAFTTDMVRVLVFTLLAVALVAPRLTGRLSGERFSLLLGILVLLDLWSVERRFIQFSAPARDSFAADQVVRTLQQDSSLYRLLPANTYQGLENYFAVHHLRSVLGYHANEPYRYDELLGGKNEWRNLGTPNILKLLAVKYVLLAKPVETPFLSAVGAGPLTTLDNQAVYVYRLRDPGDFAFLVAEALQLPDSQTIPVLLNPQFDPRRLLVVPPEAHVGVPALTALPAAVAARVAIRQTRPGSYRADFDVPLAQRAYVFFSENYDPAWRAQVDGKPAPVVRAQYALMAVPVPAGARSVELTFSSTAYRRGKVVTLVTLLMLLALVLDDRIRRRSRTDGVPETAAVA